MSITEVRFAGFDAAGERGPIRWALFQHHEVTDVQLTAQPDTLRIEHRGRADVEAWASTLVRAGLPAPRVVNERASSSADALHGASA